MVNSASGQVYLESDSTRARSGAVVVDNQSLLHSPQEFGTDIGAVFNALADRLRRAGSELKHVVKLNAYLADSSLNAALDAELRQRFEPGKLPAVMRVQTKLPQTATVALDVVATLAKGQVVSDLPPGGVDADHVLIRESCAILPAGGAAYISGQAEKGVDLRDSTAKTMESLGKTLNFLGARWSDVVQLKAFVQPMTDVATARAAMQNFFLPELQPPMIVVEWLGGGLPIEIEMIVALPKLSGASIEYLTPPDMKASPVYSRVVRIGSQRRVYISGLQVAADANGQVHGVFKELKELLLQSESDLDHLVKATYYVSEDGVSQALNTLRPMYYNPATPPAASKAIVAGTTHQGSTLTADWIAIVR